MRIAIFGTTELQSFPELQDISRRHTVIPFLAESGEDLRAWHNAMRQNHYDVLHFAAHVEDDARGWPTILRLGEASIEMEDLVSMARLSGARLLFFNGCDSAMIANYVVRNGLPASIYTTAPLSDREAWKYPLMYYETVGRQEDDAAIIDFRKAFEETVERNGFYGWASNGMYEKDLLSPLVNEFGQIYANVAQLQRQFRLLTIAGGGIVLTNAGVLMLHLLFG